MMTQKEQKVEEESDAVTRNLPWQKAFRGDKKCLHLPFVIIRDCANPENLCHNFLDKMGQKKSVLSVREEEVKE
jgi:hypothetical protein